MDELRAAFGDQFLAYVLACEENALSGSSWSPVQAQIIGQLKQLANAVADEHPLQKQLTTASALLQHNPASGTSLANTWRSECGGYLPEVPDGSDRCLAALQRMATDIYPGFMIPVSDDFPFRRSEATTALFRHPSQSTFCHAILDDERLTTFFPGSGRDGNPLSANDLMGVQSSISLSIGRGGSFQLVMFAETLLVATRNLCLLAGDDSIDAYLDKIKDILNDARMLAGGQSVPVPVVIGLNNIVLPDGCEIRLPWGLIRKPAAGDSRFLPLKKDVAAVLLLTTPVKVLSKEKFTQEITERMTESFERRRPIFEAWSNDLRRTVDLTRYALTLASQDELLIGATQQSTCVIDPLQGVPSMSWAFDIPPAAPPATLDEDAVRRVEQWARRLRSHPRKLDIAMRRTLSATVDRLDPLDGFIDAVLAWENMFSDTPETTLKVCGSIALLLEREDLNARRLLYKELHDLCVKRSRVVHGALDMSSRDAVSAGTRAVSIAIDAMRTLYDYPELLDKKSSDRGKEILLGVLDKRPPSSVDD